MTGVENSIGSRKDLFPEPFNNGSAEKQEQIRKPSNDGMDYPANAGKNEKQPVHTGYDFGAKPAHAGRIFDKPVATKRTVIPKEISVRSATAGLSLTVPLTINDHATKAVIDTAAQVTLVSEDLFGQIKPTFNVTDSIRLWEAGKNTVMVAKKVEQVPIQLGRSSYLWDVYVAPISDNCILGIDFLVAHDGKIDLGNKILTLRDENIQASLLHDESTSVRRVTLAKHVIIPPNSAVHAKVKFKSDADTDYSVNAPEFPHKEVLIPHFITKTDKYGMLEKTRTFTITLLNDSDKYKKLSKGHVVGHAEEVDVVQEKELGAASGTSETEQEKDMAETRSTLGSSSTIQMLGSKLYDFTRRMLGATEPVVDTEQDRTFKVSQICASKSVMEEAMPEHLKELWQRSCGELTEDQTIKLGNTLIEYADVFSKNDTDLGCFSEVKHKVDTGDAKPIRQKMRRTPLGFEQEEKQHLDSLEEAGVIQASSSEWASPPVLIRKKDGKVRWCIDYRALNDVTIKDAYPLPNITECLDVLGDNQFYSSLDMTSGYYQIDIEEKDRAKTAFLTKYGLYEHCRIPFGLCNAPATFQRAMMLLLRGLTWEEVLAYLDDVTILGKDFDDHLKNLVKVLERFRRYNLKLKPKKCFFFQTEIMFLGKLVKREGVFMNPSSVEAVQKWPTPTSVKEVQRFLGLVNYHRSHLKDFGGISCCLYDLTKKDEEFVWERKHQEAFERLKEALATGPCLAFPKNTDEPFILDTDASDTAIGAELIQVQDDVERVISYSSYILTSAQRNYCTTRKELLAIVRFTRQFRHYLLRRKFFVRTDHSCLRWLMGFKNPTGMLARWLEELSQYDMVVLHRQGKDHGNADALSRIPDKEVYCQYYMAGCKPEDLPCGGCRFCTRAFQQWSRFEFRRVLTEQKNSYDNRMNLVKNQDDEINRLMLVFKTEGSYNLAEEGLALPVVRQVVEDAIGLLHTYTSQEMRELQLADPDINCLLQWMEHQTQPSQRELHLSSPAVKYFWANQKLLQVKDGVLHYRWVEEVNTRSLLVVPNSLKKEILHRCHDLKLSGHNGMAGTFQRLRRAHIWYGMRTDSKLYVKSCKTCSRQKKANVKARAGLGMYHAGAPGERLHIDILGPFPESKKGNRYILVLICQFSKWFEAYALAHQTAEETARLVVDNFVSRFGAPSLIHTDQGRNFTSALFQGVCELLEITKTRTTPYRPCSNGQVERYNRTLLQLIRCHLKENNRWDEDLALLTSAIRSVPNRQTGFTPNMMMLGREVRHPADLLYPSDSPEESHPSEFVQKLRERFLSAHALVRERLQGTQQRQKDYYDIGKRQASFQVGDIVQRRNDTTKKGRSNKLKSACTAPMLITEVITPVLFKVFDRKKTSVLHHDLLKAWHDREVPLWLRKARHNVQNAMTLSSELDASEVALGGIKDLFKPVETGTSLLHSEPIEIGRALDGEDQISSNEPIDIGRQAESTYTGDETSEVSDPSVEADQVPLFTYTWVQCEDCGKWRKILNEVADQLGEEESWYCQLNTDPNFASCNIEEEDSEDWEQALDDQGFDYVISSDVHPPSSSEESVSTRAGRVSKTPARFRD